MKLPYPLCTNIHLTIYLPLVTGLQPQGGARNKFTLASSQGFYHWQYAKTAWSILSHKWRHIYLDSRGGEVPIERADFAHTFFIRTRSSTFFVFETLALGTNYKKRIQACSFDRGPLPTPVWHHSLCPLLNRIADTRKQETLHIQKQCTYQQLNLGLARPDLLNLLLLEPGGSKFSHFRKKLNSISWVN